MINSCKKVACALALLVSASAPLHAEDYPARPIRIIVPLSPGSLTDSIVRAMADRMRTTLGATFVVENLPGAGGILGTTSAAKAPPDGYTITVAAASSFSVNPHLHKNLSYDAVKDFTPVCRIGGAPYVLVANPSLGVKSVTELVAKSKTGAVTFASAGAGTIQQLVFEMFRMRTNAQFIHVPYKGTAPAVIDTVGGHSQLLFETPGPLLSHVRNGKLVALGITSSRRHASLPNVPTFEELGLQGMRMRGWIGLAVPAGTPAAIVNRLAEACRSALTAPEIEALAQPQGLEIDYAAPAEFGNFIASELQRIGQITKATGMKPE
jgi:tripartite-type tricarboxylate transporter receptor subunit TctC